jgi:hypothetical protein
VKSRSEVHHRRTSKGEIPEAAQGCSTGKVLAGGLCLPADFSKEGEAIGSLRLWLDSSHYPEKTPRSLASSVFLVNEALRTSGVPRRVGRE